MDLTPYAYAGVALSQLTYRLACEAAHQFTAYVPVVSS